MTLKSLSWLLVWLLLSTSCSPTAPLTKWDCRPSLTVIHLPIALWLAVGVAYVGGRWRGSERRMDFVRFTGELFIYYVLIALGGAVLIGITFTLFRAIGIDVESQVQGWIVPCGIAGATVTDWIGEA